MAASEQIATGNGIDKGASQMPAGAPHDAATPATETLPDTSTASLERARQAVQLGVGQIVLATMNLARYRHQTLGDLAHLFVTPLLRDRVAIARRKTEGGDTAGTDNLVGIALWATVSEAVDAKIAEQIKAKVFPVRLGPEDWTSGDIVWLLDLVAADRKEATAVLSNFRKLVGERPVKVAPLVAGLIAPEVAERLRGVGEASRTPAPTE